MSGITILRDWEFGPLSYVVSRVPLQEEGKPLRLCTSRQLVFLVPFCNERWSLQLQLVDIGDL